jgi:integrase
MTERAFAQPGEDGLVFIPSGYAQAAVRQANTAGVPITRPHPHMLRHTFVTTMLDAGVDLRDVQIAARHADPPITMRYDRARKNLDRHPNYILAAYVPSGT